MKRPQFLGVVITTIALTAMVVIFFVTYKKGQLSPRVTSSVPVSTGEKMHYPNTYTSVQVFMEGIYAADHQINPAAAEAHIRAAIIPHHLAASGSIASGIKILGHQAFKHILLLSPDHFHKCPTVLCTVDSSYQTFFGEVHASSSVVQTLLTSPLVSKDTELFKQEHGIFADLPFIAHYFPGVEVTPLVMSQVLPWKVQRTEVRDLINHVVDDETIVVISSDFSHYLPLSQADQMDQKTEHALLSKDFTALMSLNIPNQTDCANCLWTVAELAELRGFYHPTIIRHTNSARIFPDEVVTYTTSHYAMTWSENTLPTSSTQK